MKDRIVGALKRFPTIAFAYLYGSVARGTAGPLSDVDVAVYLSDESKRDPYFEVRVARQIKEELGTERDVDVRVLNGAGLRFQHQVLKYGELICSRDERLRIRFETRAIDLYLDILPHLQEYDRARRRRLKS